MSGRNGARPVGIVAFVFTDLEDSTRLWEDDAEAMRSDVARHLAIIDEAASAHGGIRAVEQGAGDSTVCAFPRASDALRAALAIQIALHGQTWASRSPLLVRVAVHVGEADVDAAGAYSGPTMNRCGRLLQAAHGGQVVASSTVLEVGGSGLDEGTTVLDLGAHRLRGIDEAVGIIQLSEGRLPTDFPPLRTIDGGSATLPVPDSPFIGRDGDVEVVADLIGSHRVLTLVGAGGCGKTRLAVEVAHGQMASFRDGVHWVDLGPVASADAVLDATATALGVRGGAAPVQARIRGRLHGRSSLVVIDNCEHVLDAVAALIADLGDGCPTVKVLATSREPIALRDEVVWRVPSLAVPAADGADLLDTDAGRLLVDRIRRVQPGYAPEDGDVAALARICRRLDGIPLALELAAARTRALSPIALADRLAERFSMLAGGGRDVLPRQRTLEASVAWSHQLLDADEREAFRRLSVFPGTFSLAGAGAVIGGGAGGRAEDAVLRLLDCSLLVDRTTGGDPRFQMLETVRWYARERLSDAGEADATFHRHLDWCCALTDDLGGRLEGPGVREALGRLESHVDDLRAAMGWALDHGRAADAALIVAATPWSWIWRGRSSEGIRWLERAERAGAEHEPADELVVGWAHLLLELSSGRSSSFRDRFGHLLRLAREVDDAGIEGRLRAALAFVLAFQEPDVAVAEAAVGRELCRANGDDFWAARTVVAVALAHITAGRFAEAEAALDELRPLARALDHPQLIADEIGRRVLVDRRFGRFEAVVAAAAEVDAVTDGFTDLNSRALVHAATAFIDVAQGRAKQALAGLEQLFERYDVAGERVYLPSFALPMMEALIDLGRPTEAIDRFADGWARWRRLVSWRLTMGPTLGLAHLCTGDVATARGLLDEALADAERTGNGFAAAVTERVLAAIERGEGEYASAERRLHRALATHADLGCPQPAADVLEELAGVELDHGRPQPAAVLFGAASTIRSQGQVVRRVGRQDAYEADVARLRAVLDVEELAGAWEQGAQLSLADAVAYAERGRGERGRPESGWESLTATEARVAELVALGHTNPEVAEALIMGRATVKTHVSSILRKLGLDNRTQLARLHAHRQQA